MKKVLVTALFVAIIALGYMQKDYLMDLIHQGGVLAVVISMLLVAICVFFPVVPFILLVGILAVVFGTVPAAAITLGGVLIGTNVMFLMARYGFRDWAQRTLDRYPKAKEYEGFFEKNAFLSVFGVRVVPVVPTQVVNILTGISKVPWVIFFTATLLGSIPRILVFAFIGQSFQTDKTTSFITYGVYMVVIMILVSVFMKRWKQGERK
ncbi:MAG TPA: VTT domain-containing protein [Bacilli bacterium]|nr:VTT domain-containing protein [Bacilli bacterium]